MDPKVSGKADWLKEKQEQSARCINGAAHSAKLKVETKYRSSSSTLAISTHVCRINNWLIN